MNVNDIKVAAGEMAILLPQRLCGDVGESLHPDLQIMIRNMGQIGWWPLDFGEGDDDHTTLWFIYEPAIAIRQAEYFIKQNGDV